MKHSKQYNENRAEAKNKIYTHLNTVIPKLLTYLKTGYSVMSNKNEFYAKDHKVIRSILGDIKDIWSTCNVDQYGTIKVECQMHFNRALGDTTSVRTEETFYITTNGGETFREFKPYPMVEGWDFDDAEKNLQEAEEKIKDIKSEISRLKFLLEK